MIKDMALNKKFILRLDDACERMDVRNWSRIENLLDKYSICPLVGVIPHCEDPMMNKYPIDAFFWEKVLNWQTKGWTIALHGFSHVYNTKCGGINPVNPRSEFAGNSYDIQAEKIRNGIRILHAHGLNPKVFFAPSHTFDQNTLRALQAESDIRIISDTWAWNSYLKDGFTYVPQQSGQVRKVPFALSTFCYHPNTMKEQDFIKLEHFFIENKDHFMPFPEEMSTRKHHLIDKLLQLLYISTRKQYYYGNSIGR